MPHTQKIVLHVISFTILYHSGYFKVVGFGGLFFLFLIHTFALSNEKSECIILFII